MPAPGETVVVGLGNWASYIALDRALEGRGYRVRYFKGLLEIMSISFKHESIKSHIGMLVEAFCLWANIDFQIWGSTTQRKEDLAGGEPDESYTFGLEQKDKPELVIEVGLTSGGIDKLEFWSELGAKEVWIWQNNALHGFSRGADDVFHPVTTSLLLPGLKLEMVEEFTRMKPSSQAVRAFRLKLEASK
jgi:Uma2 family endonuclease